MRGLKWVSILLATMALMGCTTKPIYNVTSAPVGNVKSLDEVTKAIVRAGATLGWQMQETKPGHILGTLVLRTHVAKVDVNYSTTSYSISYKDSTNLNSDGQNIHSNYNGWVQNLEKGIRTQLSLL